MFNNVILILKSSALVMIRPIVSLRYLTILLVCGGISVTTSTQNHGVGSWGEWSSWSICSRSCGTGVSIRNRECLPLSRNGGARRHGKTRYQSCLGPKSVVMTCNKQDCPAGSLDFLQAQCARFNQKVLAGSTYNWIPFYHGDECALNCRTVGYRFYAMLKPQVDDGTACKLHHSKRTNTQFLCVAGKCKEVGCDGLVGSGARRDMCGVCAGNNSTCRLVSGLFTRPQLPHGYNLITQLPRGASNITIVQLRSTRNYLALRKKDGSYILNGNWAINLSGEYSGAGTKFSYQRDDNRNSEGEYIKSLGPLTDAVDLMIIYQQPNPGVKYQYQLPVIVIDTASAPPLTRHSQENAPFADNTIHYARHSKQGLSYGRDLLASETQSVVGDEGIKHRTKAKKKKFIWKISGYSECSKSCGGGIQTPTYICIRENNEAVVPDKRCLAIEKHSIQPKRCNIKPCVAEWTTGEWSSCSVSCGEGVETREVLCRQEISQTLTVIVASAACLTPQPTGSRKCYLPPCHGSNAAHQWQVGYWSECSTGCGNGVKTRLVYCPVGECPASERPNHIMHCNLGACKNTKGFWIFTDWSQCSANCGTGVQTRRVICNGNGECNAQSQPESTRACSSDKKCSGQWFTGPWQTCSGGCGIGEQSRTVLCIAQIHNGENVVTTEASCRSEEKPVTVQKCQLQPCSPQWFFGDWGQCSRSCDSGVQKREVWCIDENQTPSTSCIELQKPTVYHICNTQPCNLNGGDTMEKDESNKDNVTLQTESTSSRTSSEGECVDTLRNCHLVVQARLCQYKYYKNSCCQSCLNKT